MIRTFKIIVILTFIFLGELVYAQQVQPVVELNTPETTPRVVRASQIIRLLPGFTATAGFTAKIVEEYVYDQVIGGAYNLNENRNWVASTSYDLSGRLTASGIGYYNSLGKATQNQSLDIKTGKIWASEVRYDEFGRPAFSSLSAPVDSLNYGYKSNFLSKRNGSAFTRADLANITNNASDVKMSVQKNKVGWYYSENNNSEKYQDVTNYPYRRTIYSTLNPGLPLKTLGGNKIKKTADASEEWLQGYSFDMPLAQELFYEFGKDYFPKREGIIEIEQENAVSTTAIRNGYNLYTIEDVTNGCDSPEPSVQIRLIDNQRLVRGKIYKISYTTGAKYYRVIAVEFRFDRGGGDGLILERSSVPTPTNQSPSPFIYGSLVDKHTYNCPLGKPYFIRGTKTVVRDVHGVESVVFKDSEGNVLAAARSGNEDGKAPTPYRVISPIGEQGYVDIHIPVGCGGSIRLMGPQGTWFKIYDLVSDSFLRNGASGFIVLNSGMYRVKVVNSENYKPLHPYVAYNPSLKLADPNNTFAVEYKVNYYDYSLNYYDKAGRLTKSTQPLSKDLETTFKYNTLGQLLETESPDEGKAEFKYRKDGQIRFSQNSKQKLVNEFSYTNYDNYGRPIESGVAGGNFADLNADAIFFKVRLNSKKEQHYTAYDETDQVNLNTALTRANISTNISKYKQQFIAGNVSKTYTDNPKTNTTWYSYDIYGRVTWMVQDIYGLGVKTIDYEYDFAKGQVTKVYYQRYNTEEQFVHKYTYNIAGELYTVETSTDNKNFEEQGKYKYYETGALKRVEVAENVQGIDYIYNLNGQLKAINHPSTASNLDPGKDGSNGMARDLFGFAIDYYNGDYTRSNTPTPVTSNHSLYANNQYNGNIKATRWANGSINNRKQASQVYSYNKNNWLKTVDFGTASNTGAIVKNSYNNYKVYGLEYDANGNIQKLNRNKDGNTNNAMDRMVYNYKMNKPNQLTSVDDSVNAGVEDMIGQTSNNYEYNDIGQLVKNEQDKLEYFYNASGLVTEIQKEGKPQVKFYYDDRGYRIRKESNFTGAYTGVTYYVRDASGNPISIVTPAIGKTVEKPTIEHPIYGASRLGIYNKKGDASVYQLTDHLGNVRAVAGKDAQGNIVVKSATDYYPFGMAMPGRQTIGGETYRYAYQGQEKDSETGKEAFQLRLWDGRIGRWLTTDPAAQFSSPYLGMGNNPITGIDKDGDIVIFPDIASATRAQRNLNSLFSKKFKFNMNAVWIKRITYKNHDGKMVTGYSLQTNRNERFKKMLADLSLSQKQQHVWESFKDILQYKHEIVGELVPSTAYAARLPTFGDVFWGSKGPYEDESSTIGEGGTYSNSLFRVNKELPDHWDNSANFNIASTILHEILWHLSPMGKYWLDNKIGTAKKLFEVFGVSQDTNFDALHSNGPHTMKNLPARPFPDSNKIKD